MKGIIKRDNPHPSFAATSQPQGQQSIFDHKNLKANGAEDAAAEKEFEHPDQPQDDNMSPPDLSTFKSQTLPMHNSEGDAPHENISNISPNK